MLYNIPKIQQMMYSEVVLCFIFGCSNGVTEEQKQKAELIYDFVIKHPSVTEVGFDGDLYVTTITLLSIKGEKVLELDYANINSKKRINEIVSGVGPLTARYYKYDGDSFSTYVGGDSLSLKDKTNVLAITDWDTAGKTKEQLISSLYSLAKEL